MHTLDSCFPSTDGCIIFCSGTRRIVCFYAFADDVFELAPILIVNEAELVPHNAREVFDANEFVGVHELNEVEPTISKWLHVKCCRNIRVAAKPAALAIKRVVVLRGDNYFVV